MLSPNRRIAILIDGDNAQPSQMEAVLAETGKQGAVVARRVYANWTSSGKSAWKAAIHANGMLPVQQFAYVSGKNATDIALVIEAMYLMHSGTVDGFCIVSSDSDYTRLAIRIREAGMFMMGIGRSDTPQSFVSACEVFVRTETLAGAGKPKKKRNDAATPTKRQATSSPDDGSWVATVGQAIRNAAKDDGWAHLGAIGNQIKQIDSAFESKAHGYRQLGQLIKSRSDVFETKGSQASIYVRSRRG